MNFFGVTDDGNIRFAESEAKEIKLTPFQWTRSCPLSDNYFTRFKNENGVSSLAEMALRSVVRYRHALAADVLEEISWDPLGARIWKEIKAMRGVTVSVWKEFAKAYASREETKPELSVLLAPTILPMDLLALTFPMLDSLNHDFLTLVNIVNQPMDLSRWMSFCELRNLRTLLVDTGRLPTRFDERVARGWSAHAIENGAFGQLYAFILCAYNGRHTISRQSMNHLLDLPLLHMVCLRRVHLPKVTDEHNFGWRREWPDHITDSSSGSSANSSLASLYDRLQTNCPSPALSNSTPRLVVRVGDAADENVFRLSYLLSSFTVMVRDVARKKKNQNDAVPVPASIQPQQKPKMRKRAQKEFGDLLSSFGN